MIALTKHTIYQGIVLFLIFNFISCIKQSSEDCPVSYRGILIVQDKNYSNATEIPGLSLRDEQQAFRQYIPDFSYSLIQLGTGTTVDSLSNYTVTDEEKTHKLDFPTILPAQYKLNIYGNTNQIALRHDNTTTYTLHPTGQEGDDIYLFNDTIIFTPEQREVSIPMRRAKGALFIQIENIPDSVSRIRETIGQIYNNIDEKGVYSDETTVVKDFDKELHPSPSLLTLLAPTVAGKQSLLRIALYTSGDTYPYLFIPDIQFAVKRNEITAFKFSFQPEGGIEVWILANGTWNKLHDLDIVTNE